MALLDQTMTDREFAEIYAKMLDRPDELSVAERLQVNGFLNLVLMFVQRECYLVRTTVFVECDAAINEVLPKFFGSTYAKSWWSTNRPLIEGKYGDHGGWVERVDVQIGNLDPESEMRYLQEIDAGL
jgi:hypothetical protein